MKVDELKTLRDLIRKLDMIEEEQHLNEKRIKEIRMTLVHMLPLMSSQ